MKRNVVGLLMVALLFLASTSPAWALWCQRDPIIQFKTGEQVYNTHVIVSLNGEAAAPLGLAVSYPAGWEAKVTMPPSNAIPIDVSFLPGNVVTVTYTLTGAGAVGSVEDDLRLRVEVPSSSIGVDGVYDASLDAYVATVGF